MKILFIDNSFWAAKNFRYHLIKELHNNNDLKIVAGNDSDLDFFLSKGFNCNNLRFSSTSKNPFQDFLYFLKLLRIILNFQPDYILTFTIKPNLYCSIIAFITRIKLIVTITGFGRLFLNDSKINKVLFRLIFKIILLGSNKVVFQNKDDKQYIENKYHLDKEKVNFYISPGSGVNVDKFIPDKFGNQICDLKRDKKNSEIKFLFLGRLFKDKGIHELIEALNLCIKNKFNFHFGFYGDIANDDDGNEIRKKLDALTSKSECVKYYGFCDDIKRVLNSYDVIVLPSYREGLPKSLLEAAAMQLTLLASDVPGCREVVVDNRNGFLFKPFSSKEIFDAIKKVLLLSQDDLKNFGEHSRLIAKKEFDQSNVLNLYNNLLN